MSPLIVAADGVTISTILADVSSIVTEAVTWLGSFAGAITANPIILIFVIMSLVGVGIGYLKSLMGA